MAFSMFSAQATPIAIDFGSSGVKILQISQGDPAKVLCAAEIPLPDRIRMNHDECVAFCAEQIPKTMAEVGFKGKRVILGIPAHQTFTQHMQLPKGTPQQGDMLIKEQLQSQIGCAPSGIVVRSVDVSDVNVGGQIQRETICFAIARETVMSYVELLKRCKLTVVGVHTEAPAMVRAFEHLNRRSNDDDTTTLYIDIGWGGSLVGVAHGPTLTFARYIQFGGRSFDQQVASTLHCSLTDARAHRLSPEGSAAFAGSPAKSSGGATPLAAALQPEDSAAAIATQEEERRHGQSAASIHAVPSGNPPTSAGRVDLNELLDTIADEMHMCVRYHRGLFPNRPLSRVIFLGGEARQTWLCQHVVKALRLPAQLGDPVARLNNEGARVSAGLDLNQPQPGWAVAYGLCLAPTDL